jgi:hypothetical protein
MLKLTKAFDLFEIQLNFLGIALKSLIDAL